MAQSGGPLSRRSWLEGQESSAGKGKLGRHDFNLRPCGNFKTNNVLNDKFFMRDKSQTTST